MPETAKAVLEPLPNGELRLSFKRWETPPNVKIVINPPQIIVDGVSYQVMSEGIMPDKVEYQLRLQ